MDLLETARQFRNSGHYHRALEILAAGPKSPSSAWLALKAEVLERHGQTREAQQLAEHLLRTRETNLRDQATSQDVVAKVLLESGDVDGAVERLQRSISLARQSGDLHRLSWSQLALLMLVADRAGPDAARPLLVDVRRTTIKLGDPRSKAALHMHVGELEAKRGLFASALRHIAIGQSLLKQFPNAWLEAFGENVRMAVGILRADFQTAFTHGQRAIELAEQSGVASISRSAIANRGNYLYSTGDFDNALEHFDRSESFLPTRGEKTNAILDSIARTFLALDRLKDCANVLDRINRSIRSPLDRVLSGNRSAELTRGQLWARLERSNDAITQFNFALQLAEQAGDAYLFAKASLALAEILSKVGRFNDAIAIIGSVVPHLTAQSPELYARAERILAAVALGADNSEFAARSHYERAKRICAAVKSVPEQLESGVVLASRPRRASRLLGANCRGSLRK